MASMPGTASRSEPRAPSASTPETLSPSMLFRPMATMARNTVGSAVGASFRVMPGMVMPDWVTRAMPFVRESPPTEMPLELLALMRLLSCLMDWNRSSDSVALPRARAFTKVQGISSCFITVPSASMYSSRKPRPDMEPMLRAFSWLSSRRMVWCTTGMEQKG